MRMVDCIERKASGGELTGAAIRSVIAGYTAGEIPDYQMAAFMMAVRFQSMTDRETADLTYAMMHSGETVDLSDLPGIKLDKHSTGGVGDTTTLVVAPLVAACGGTVAKMSGRGLTFTGGTLDKLETIPGLNVEQPIERFKEIVRSTGLAVIGQSGNLDPADKKMYALRDVTGTVRSIPLIASSIMSKKLASGADAIVLDVKVGSGAFLKDLESARELARIMCSLGRRLNRKVSAVLTDMNEPLGRAVGNAQEFAEAVDILCGKVPEDDRLVQVCFRLGTELLLLAGIAKEEEEAKSMLRDAIRRQTGLACLKRMVREMGGAEEYVDPVRIRELCRTERVIVYPAPEDGYVTAIRAISIGLAAQMLGAGRAVKEDQIDHAVGIWMHKRVGEPVRKGEPVCTFYVNDDTNVGNAVREAVMAIAIGPEPPESRPLIYEVFR